ncbi:MAG TPA: hypothetical protein VFZ70_11665 [Euzebyales bacterium]
MRAVEREWRDDDGPLGAPQHGEATLVDPSHQRAEAPDPSDARAMHGEPEEIETPVSAGERVRGTVDAALTALRSSVPVRTVLLLLPPLFLPPLVFDLSFGATLLVWLLLLWLVGATAVVTTLMADGADLLAMRAIGRHLEQLAAGVQRPAERPADDEALLVVGEQLDALNDRLDALDTRHPTSGAGPIDHRPPEQWSGSRGVADNDGDHHDVAHGRHWSSPRWQR